jgi:hypothetical protein
MIAVVLAALLGTDAPADAAPPQASADQAPALTFRGHLQWITAGGGTILRDTPVNPGNRVLELPQVAAESELRPDLRFEYGSQLTALVRPRFLLQVQRSEAGGVWAPERSAASSQWIELYATWRLDDRLAISYGLQNFQWGPAELMSPSNRIFHATGFTRDPLYVVRGRHLARVNVSAGRAWSAVLLAEVAPDGEPAFVADEPFEPKAQLKVEYAAPTGDRYLGITAGAAQRSRAWFGEYATVPLWAGLSAYADAVHTVGRRAWYPVDDGAGGAAFAQTGMETRNLRTLALGGLRYSFEGGADVRLEYVFDEAGWNRGDLARASRAASADPRLVGRYLDPGFELLGRQLAYVSVLLPDLPPVKRTTVQARYLRSVTDGSGAAFVTTSYAATDAVVMFLSASVTHGAADGAVSRLVRGAGVLGAEVSW